MLMQVAFIEGLLRVEHQVCLPSSCTFHQPGKRVLMGPRCEGLNIPYTVEFTEPYPEIHGIPVVYAPADTNNIKETIHTEPWSLVSLLKQTPQRFPKNSSAKLSLLPKPVPFHRVRKRSIYSAASANSPSADSTTTTRKPFSNPILRKTP